MSGICDPLSSLLIVWRFAESFHILRAKPARITVKIIGAERMPHEHRHVAPVI